MPILDVQGTTTIQGASFSPSTAGQTLPIRFDAATEPGEVGTRGRYRGRPTPYGSAEFHFAAGSTLSIPADIAACLKGLLSRVGLGIDSVVLHYDVWYSSQCNIELRPEFLKEVANLGIQLTVSCYEEPNPRGTNSLPVAGGRMPE